MSQMVELLKTFPLADGGFSESRLKGVRFFKSIQHIPRAPKVYDPGICIVAKVARLATWATRCLTMMPTIIWWSR